MQPRGCTTATKRLETKRLHGNCHDSLKGQQSTEGQGIQCNAEFSEGSTKRTESLKMWNYQQK